MVDVLLRRFAEYHYGELSFNAGHDCVHGTLESAGCVAESKWPTYKVIETVMGCECSLMFIWIINLDLPTSRNSFRRQKDCRLAKGIYALIPSCYLVSTSSRYCVTFTIVDSQSESFVFLKNEYYRRCSFHFCGLENILGEDFSVLVRSNLRVLGPAQ